MNFAVVAILLTLAPFAFAGSETGVSQNSNAVAATQKSPRECKSFLADIMREFGFDKPENVESSRARDGSKNFKGHSFEHVTLTAMALKDGKGEKMEIFPASGAKRIEAKEGSSTLRTTTGLDEKNGVPAYEVQIFSAKSGNEISIIAEVKDSGKRCVANHIKINGQSFGIENCQTNSVSTSKSGKLQVNAEKTDKQRACNAVWPYF